MRLYVAISHHGYGHLAQTAPVLEALSALLPEVKLLVRCALPREVIDRRVKVPFEHIPLASDCNFVMHDSIRLDREASLAGYHAFHAGWDECVAREADALTELGVTALYSNVGYLPLAAARAAGIPALAMCSLNWADIFRHYLADAPGADDYLDVMSSAYASAAAFLRPEPSMPMSGLGNAREIGPVAQAGHDRRLELARRLELPERQRLVVVGMGGIPYRPEIEAWPRLPGMTLLVPDAWRAVHPDARPIGACGMSFRDLLASVDVLITKPGYGSYVEAAASGLAVLHIPRPDWPETPYLDAWLRHHATARMIDETALRRGDFIDVLDDALAAPRPKPPATPGAWQAARWLLDLLTRPERLVETLG